MFFIFDVCVLRGNVITGSWTGRPSLCTRVRAAPNTTRLDSWPTNRSCFSSCLENLKRRLLSGRRSPFLRCCRSEVPPSSACHCCRVTAHTPLRWWRPLWCTVWWPQTKGWPGRPSSVRLWCLCRAAVDTARRTTVSGKQQHPFHPMAVRKCFSTHFMSWLVELFF